ncbi:MAG: ABC transporter ATP-binding protein [Nitrospinaceae bacterium]|nr:ABC transporter ATP-binding protein [Nitrospinaceae bacterium]MBT3433398.1 ABC transporter ATP-binding protein [Nitrospinaceae bacterium]MBT4429381.1 ABC transporter ATP-binding protein [Nitrospinaceae bacterium]MBT5367605.1 ABC transporter ATP-binding protein [Nitrospinaceae bacterium]MBT5946568.1 ABC transporter ATP-binding protein [Nitrospinaceae bacterium]
MPTKIEIKNLRKVYDTPERKVHALEDVNINIEDGEFLCLVGLSGCGKTTLLNILAGFVEITAGTVNMDGVPITDEYDKGVVFQEYALFPWLTAVQNVEYGMKIRDVPADERHKTAMDFLKLVRLEEFADLFPHSLSGGMRQRVAVARALAFDPQVLLMDEPFGALDAQTREELQELTVDVWQKTKKTVVYVTHNLAEAVFMGTRVVVFIPQPGRIREILTIDMPRPRDALSAEFIQTQRNINELIRDW